MGTGEISPGLRWFLPPSSLSTPAGGNSPPAPPAWRFRRPPPEPDSFFHLSIGRSSDHPITSLSSQGKRQRERRSPSLLALHPNRSAVLLDHLVRNCQTQPRAAALGGKSRLKDLLQILRPDAAPLIC